MLCMMVAVIILMAPSAFAEDPPDVASASIGIPVAPSSPEATYDGATEGNITTGSSEITEVEISYDERPNSTTEVKVEGVNSGSTGNTDETFYAGANVTPRNMQGQATTETDADIKVTVEGAKIDTENEGINLYKVEGSTNTLVKEIETTAITTSDNKSTVVVDMASLYNFMLMKYSKYNTKTIDLVSTDNGAEFKGSAQTDKMDIDISVKSNDSNPISGLDSISAEVKTPTATYLSVINPNGTEDLKLNYIVKLTAKNGNEAATIPTSCDITHKVQIKDSKYSETATKAITLNSKNGNSYIDVNKNVISVNTNGDTYTIRTNSASTNYYLTQYDKFVEVTENLTGNAANGFTKTISGVEINVNPDAEKSIDLTGIDKITATVKTIASKFQSRFESLKQGQDEFSNWFKVTLLAKDSSNGNMTIPQGAVSYNVTVPKAEDSTHLITLYKNGSSSESRDELTIDGTTVTIKPASADGEFLLIRFDPYETVAGTVAEKLDSTSGKYIYTISTDHTINTSPKTLTGNKVQIVITSASRLRDVSGNIITGIDSRYIKYVLNKEPSNIASFDAIKAIIMDGKTDEIFFGATGYADIKANKQNGDAATIGIGDISFQIVSANETTTNEFNLYNLNANWNERSDDTTSTKTLDSTNKIVSISPKAADAGLYFVTLSKYKVAGTITFDATTRTGTADVNCDGVKSVTIKKSSTVKATSAKVLFPTKNYLATEELCTKDAYFNILKIALFDAEGKENALAGYLEVEIVREGALFDNTQYVSLYEEKINDNNPTFCSEDVESITISGSGDTATTSIKTKFSSQYIAAFKLISGGRPITALTINGHVLTADELQNGYTVTSGGVAVLKYLPEIGLVRLNGYENKEVNTTTIDATGNLMVDVAKKSLITGSATAIKSSGTLRFIGKALLEVAVDEGVTPISPTSYTAKTPSLIYTNDCSDKLSRIVSVRIKTKDASGNPLTYSTGGNTVQTYTSGSGYSGYGFESGLVLTTGGSNSGTNKDRAEINAQVLSETYQSANGYGDIAVYEFAMTSSGTKLSFDYIFASSEFTYGKQYNDAFGLFVDIGDGNGYKNIAKFVSPVTGKEENITMSNLRIAIGAQDGYGNPIYGKLLSDPTQLQYKNGNYYTKVYTASIPVSVGANVKVKYVVTDVGDSSVDSFVMIREGSFSFESKVIFDDGIGNLKSATVVDGQPMTEEDALEYFLVDDPDPTYGSKVGYKPFDNANGKWLDQNGNEITKTYTDWAKVSKVTAQYELATYALNLYANNEKCGQIDFVYAIDWSALRETAEDLYAPEIKGYEFKGWANLPTTKPKTNREMNDALRGDAILEAKSYTLTLEDYFGNRRTVQVIYDQVIPDVTPAEGFGLTFFAGYYLDGVMIYDPYGHANGYVWKIDPSYGVVKDQVHTDNPIEEPQPLILAKARYVTMNAYRYERDKTYAIDSNEDLTMKYKYTGYSTRMTDKLMKELRVSVNGVELNKEFYSVTLDVSGNVIIEIDKDYLKELGIGEYELLVLFLNAKFGTSLTIK